MKRKPPAPSVTRILPHRCSVKNRLPSYSSLVFASMALAAGPSLTPAQAIQAEQFLVSKTSAKAPSGARQLCRKYAWACSRSAHGKKIWPSDMLAIGKVNRSVNRGVREISDLAQFQVSEVWSLPTSQGGDCEDFALLKKRELIKRGFPAQSLLIATALDKQRRGHVVLIVRTASGDYVLDNQTSKIRRWSDTGYVFLRMQNPNAPERWLNLAMMN